MLMLCSRFQIHTGRAGVYVHMFGSVSAQHLAVVDAGWAGIEVADTGDMSVCDAAVMRARRGGVMVRWPVHVCVLKP